MNEPTSFHLSAITLDSLLLGALSPEDEQRTRSHLEHCQTCAQRMHEIHTSAEHFYQVVHPRTLEQLSQRMEQLPVPARSWRRFAWGAAVLLMALMALLLMRELG